MPGHFQSTAEEHSRERNYAASAASGERADRELNPPAYEIITKSVCIKNAQAKV